MANLNISSQSFKYYNIRSTILNNLEKVRLVTGDNVTKHVSSFEQRFRKLSAFGELQLIQEINEEQGQVRCTKFSRCGQLLATGGVDTILRVYCCHRVWRHFVKIRAESQANQEAAVWSCAEKDLSDPELDLNFVLFAMFEGHTLDIIDIAWSSCNFLLSASLDKCVRLWHVAQPQNCLCCFQHSDFVSTMQFLPFDDSFFITCSLDGKVRMWNIKEKTISFSSDVRWYRDSVRSKCDDANTITACCFLYGGEKLVLGTNDGRLLIFYTDKLRYLTQIYVCAKANPKVISIECLEDDDGKTTDPPTRPSKTQCKLLVTCADAMTPVLIFQMDCLALKCVRTFKGPDLRCGVPIPASVSLDQQLVTCGSENNNLFIWNITKSTSCFSILSPRKKQKLGKKRNVDHKKECSFSKSSSSIEKNNTEKQNQENMVDSGMSSESSNDYDSLDNSNATISAENDNDKMIVNLNVKPAIALFAPKPELIALDADYILVSIDFKGYISLFKLNKK